MNPFSTTWKYQKTVSFSDAFGVGGAGKGFIGKKLVKLNWLMQRSFKEAYSINMSDICDAAF